MKGNRKRRPCSHDRLFLNSGNFKTGLVGGRLKGKRAKEFQVPQDASARCTDVVMAVSFYLSRKKRFMARFSPACRGKGDHGNVACTCDSLFPLPGEEKAIMGTWQGCLLWPFSPACQAKGYFTAPVEGPGNLRRECSRWPFPHWLSTKRQFNRFHGGPLDSSAEISGSARDGLFPMPIEGNAISGLHQKRPGCLPKMPGELEAENYIDC